MGVIRTYLQQPALPSYRVSVFRALAQRPGIDLNVVYDETDGIGNVAPSGFRATELKSKVFHIVGRKLHWHKAMLNGATPDQADVLVLSWNLNYLSLLPALLRARRNGVATVLWGHGYTKVDAWYRSWPRARVTALADALLFYDRTHADAFIASTGVDCAKVFVAQNALDDTPMIAARQSWLARPDDLAAFRHEQGIEGRDVVLFVSRLTEKARVDLLIDAIPSLLKRRPNALVVFIGAGDTAPWQARADALGVGQAVRFTGAIYDEMKLAPWFIASGVFCYPSGVGLSIIHAFNYALPIVTDDNYALHNPEVEALRPGENGLLYRYNDAADLAAKLADLLGDPSRRAKMADAALKIVREKYNLKTMIDGFEAAIRYAYAKRHP